MRCSRRGGGATAQAARTPWSMGYGDRRGAERLSRYREEEFEERGRGSWLAHQRSYMRSKKKTTGQPNANVRIATLDVRERPFTRSSQEESQSCFAPDPSLCLQPSPYRLYQPSKVFFHPY